MVPLSVGAWQPPSPAASPIIGYPVAGESSSEPPKEAVRWWAVRQGILDTMFEGFQHEVIDVGVTTIAGLSLIEKYRPKWPAPLIAVAIAVGCVAWFGLQNLGVELVGPIPAGLPALTMPDVSLAQQLWPGESALGRLIQFGDAEGAEAGRAMRVMRSRAGMSE